MTRVLVNQAEERGGWTGGSEEGCAEGELVRRWPWEELLAGNLAALGERDGELAARIGAAAAPAGVERAAARDGSVSYRLAGPEGRREWLGYSSMPLISARANLERTRLSGGNAAMNGIGHGADAEELLGRMGGHQALFVLEREAYRVKLVLGLRDFREALRAGRLVVVVGAEPAAALGEFLRGHRGYGIIDQAISCVWLSEQENQQFAAQVGTVMEEYAQETLAACQEMLGRWKERERGERPEEVLGKLARGRRGSLRAASVLQAKTPTIACAAREALAGLAELGVQVDAAATDRPDEVSQYAQLRRYEEVRPDLLLMVDMVRGEAGMMLPEGAIGVTLVRQGGALWAEGQSKAGRMGAEDFVCVGRQEQMEKLRQGGYREERLVRLGAGANTALFRPVELSAAERERYGGEVVLVADRASTDPKTYEIQLPTHQRLLQAVSEEIHRRPQEYYREAAGRFLRRGQRCGVEVREGDVQEYFTELIGNALGETALYDSYGLALAGAGFDFRIWGQSMKAAGPGAARADSRGQTSAEKPGYWGQSPVAAQVAGAVDYGEELNKVYNGGKIHLWLSSRAEVQEAVLNGMAAGAFFLVKSHPGHGGPDGLGRYLELGREVVTFDTARDLVRKVRYYLEHEDERRALAAVARQKVLTRYSYGRRMAELLDVIGERLGGRGT